MACPSSSFFKSRFLLASTVLFLFTPPILSILNFFWPLILSTVLGVLAVLSFERQGGGVCTEQEEVISEIRLADTDTDASLAAHMEEISEVLMVGNHEVGWLEWLHNEDMEKCRAQDQAHIMHAKWVSDGNGVAIDSSVDDFPSRPKEKSVMDAYGPMLDEENSVNVKVKDANALSSTEILDDDICTRTQVDDVTSLIAPVSPVADLCGADPSGIVHEDENAVRKNVPLPLDEEYMVKQIVLTDELLIVLQKEGNSFPAESALVVDAVTLKDVCSDSMMASKTCGNVHEVEVISEKIEESNCFDFAGHNGGKSGFADGAEVQIRMASAVQDESLVDAFTLEVGDVTTREGITTPQCGLKVVEQGKESERTLVDGDEGECVLQSLSSKVMTVTELIEFPPLKNGLSLTGEQEVSVERETERHTHEEDLQEKDIRKNNGPLWNVSDDEEDKSSLHFSFFHNGCLTLTEVKQETGDVALQL